ncbi:MAG TPA: 30S ribosomal protein S13 [Candidatus Nitrosopelagicus sp.]|nr:30S ribosomal protein S13 [Candidatus Nitrosopelagicus sp.]
MIRILGNDILGDKKMIVGLTQIKGVGYMFANSIINNLKIDSSLRIGNLSNEQVKSIENIIQNPLSSNFPSWFLNRRKDIETGEDKHLITSDIDFTVRNDVEREKATGSWRGYRHMFGLKVRGQRTRCTGRKGGAVGVAKGGRVLPAQAGGAAEGGAAEGGAAEGAPAVEEAPAAEGAKGSTVATKPGVENKQAPKTEKKEAPDAKKT